MRRWKISTMITSGTVTNAPAAMIAAYDGVYGLMPEKRAIATVTGSVPVVESCCDSRNSFQVMMNARIAVVNSAGAASGRMILTNACPRVAPSTRSEEHTSELQSRFDLVCRLLLE